MELAVDGITSSLGCVWVYGDKGEVLANIAIDSLNIDDEYGKATCQIGDFSKIRDSQNVQIAFGHGDSGPLTKRFNVICFEHFALAGKMAIRYKRLVDNDSKDSKQATK